MRCCLLYFTLKVYTSLTQERKTSGCRKVPAAAYPFCLICTLISYNNGSLPSYFFTCPTQPSMKEHILITGGSGLVGTRLTEMLLEGGYQVSHLSRSRTQRPAVTTYVWNIKEKEIEPESLTNTDYVVHLAGAGVADQRWSKSRKEVILKSRTESTRLLHDTIAQLGNHQIKAFIASSAIGIYGEDTGSDEITESSPKGDDFLAEVTRQWEAAVDEISRLNIRVVKLRTGVALSDQGGALVKIVQPVRLGVGAPLGSGKQYMSWIHIDDLCRMYLFALKNHTMQGAYNAVGPQPVTNATLTRAAARVLGKPLWLPPVPAFALRLALGEMASVVLGGAKVSGKKIEEAGFEFTFNNIDTALINLLR